VSANFAVFDIVDASGNGVLTVFPTGTPSATMALVNWASSSSQIDNACIVPVGVGGEVTMTPQQGGGSVNVAIDISGYFSGNVITGVTPGTGLTGGGTSGVVSLGIANGGVGTAQLATGAVASGNIAPNAVGSAAIAPGAVGTSQLANASVTAAKVSASGSTSGQVLVSNGSTVSWQTTSAAGFVRTVVVSPVPGDAAASGTALLNALAGITDASVTNPYLVKIEPGVFDLGNSTLTTKLYVDVEGSGRLVTTITSGAALTIDDSASVELRSLTLLNKALTSSPAVIGANGGNVRLRDALVSINGGSTSSTGIYAPGGNSGATLRDVQVTASGPGSVIGIFVHIGDLRNVTVGVSGGTANQGVVSNLELILSDSTVTALGSASDGVFAVSGPARITNSTIQGANSSLRNGNCLLCDEARVATSQLIGSLQGPGQIRCRDSWDQNWDSVCQ
jgi:hypothetical protein